MATPNAMNEDDRSVESPGELWALVRDYAKQETIEPLRSVGRFVGYGLAGAILFAIGTIFAVVAVLRVLQEETGERLTGSWNFLPYAVVLLLLIVIISVCIRTITKPNRTGGN